MSQNFEWFSQVIVNIHTAICVCVWVYFFKEEICYYLFICREKKLNIVSKYICIDFFLFIYKQIWIIQFVHSKLFFYINTTFSVYLILLKRTNKNVCIFMGRDSKMYFVIFNCLCSLYVFINIYWFICTKFVKVSLSQVILLTLKLFKISFYQIVQLSKTIKKMGDKGKFPKTASFELILFNEYDQSLPKSLPKLQTSGRPFSPNFHSRQTAERESSTFSSIFPMIRYQNNKNTSEFPGKGPIDLCQSNIRLKAK